MKKIYLFLLMCFLGTSVFAQIPDGSIAPDWTLTDLNGVTVNLYDVLDSDKSVIIDFSATWCGPCWNYHNTHIMEDVYNEYGPNGSVDPGKVEVYYIESDSGTNDPCMTDDPGCTGGTQGDWTEGSSYSLFNPASEAVRTAYGANSYPTLLAVCPNRKLYEVGQASKTTWISWLMETCSLDQDFLVSDNGCYGDGNGGIDLTVTGGFGSATFQWSNGASTEDLVGVEAGTYECTITEARGHSIETGPLTVGGPTSPVQASGGVVNDVLCNGAANGVIEVDANGGAGGYSFAWSNGATTSTISNLEPNVYDLVVTDVDGCTFETSYEIVEPLALSVTTAEFPASCSQDNGFVTLQSNGGTGPYIYDIGITANSSGAFINLPAGDYDATVTDNNGCAINTSFTIAAVAPPEAQASSDGLISCTNFEMNLSAEGSSTGSVITYSWSTADGNIIAGANSMNPTINQPGTYELTVYDAQHNCSETASVLVEANLDTPTANAGTEGEINCVDIEATLDGSASSTGDNITYQWSTVDGNILTDATMVTIEVNAAGTYSLEVTNEESGCSDVSQVTVIQSAELPEANAGETQSLNCNISEIDLDGTQSSIGDNYTYQWSTTDGVIVSGENSLIVTVNETGTYLLEVINTLNGCFALSSVEVVLDVAVPSATIAEPQTLTCELEEQGLNIDVDLEGDYELTWTTMDGNIVSGGDSDQPIIDAPGEYSVLIVNLENGCSSTQSVIVSETINTPSAAYSYTSAETKFNFTESSVGNPSSYLWTFGDGNTSTDQNPTHTYADNGTYDVCLTITNECGESQTCETVTVSFGSALVYDVSSLNPTCFGSCNGSFEIVPQDEIANYSVVVSGPDGYMSTEFTATDLCNGEYNFTLTNEIGESIDGAFEVNEPTAIEVGESDIIHVDCYGQYSGTVYVSLTGGVGEITLDWDNGSEGNLVEDLPAGDYSVVGTDENGCSKTFEFTILEAPELVLTSSEVTDGDDANPFGSVEVVVDGGTGDYSYKWSNGAETQNLDGVEAGEYSVVVTDDNGCQKTFGPFEVKIVLGVNDIETLEAFRLSPNPASDIVNIKLDFDILESAEISIINSLGQIVDVRRETGRTISYNQDITDFVSGLYFIKVTVNNQSTMKKLIIE